MEKTKTCPYCGEEIMADAKKCRHCGEWLGDEPESKQEPEKQSTQEPISVKPTSYNKRAKSNKTLIVIIAIAAVIALVVGGLLLFGSSDSEGEDFMDNKLEKDLETLVAEAYRTHEIYNLETSEFKAAVDAAMAYEDASGLICVEWDYYYGTQEDIDLVKVSDVQAEIIGENKARVFVTLKYEWGSEPTTVILLMMRDSGTGKWLVDDVRTTGESAGSIKELMYNCAKESESSDDYEVDEEVKVGVETPQTTDINQTAIKGNRFVVIDGSDLRLRLGASTSSETFKWPDGSNRHPNVGDKYRYLGESGDFYKIDFNGNELWVSKQFTHVE